MAVTAFMPYIEVVISIILKQIFRILDSGSCGGINPNKSTKKTYR